MEKNKRKWVLYDEKLPREDIRDLHNLVQSPPITLPFAARGEVNPKLRVLVVNFDGTSNDRSKRPEGEDQTFIAEMAGHFEHHSQSTSNALPTLKSIYVKGVGTDGEPIPGRHLQSNDFIDRKLSLAFGDTTVERAELAYFESLGVVRDWVKEDPNCKVHLHVTGFSRGAVSALYFMNLVERVGFTPFSKDEDPNFVKVDKRHFEKLFPDAESILTRERDPFGSGKIPMTSVLIDAVATGKKSTDEYKAAVSSLFFPASVWSALYIRSKAEDRPAFTIADLNDGNDSKTQFRSVCSSKIEGSTIRFGDPTGNAIKRVNTVEIPGAVHAASGGSYGESGHREVVKYLIDCFNASLGLPAAPEKPSVQHVQTVFPTKNVPGPFNCLPPMPFIYNESNFKTSKAFGITSGSKIGKGVLHVPLCAPDPVNISRDWTDPFDTFPVLYVALQLLNQPSISTDQLDYSVSAAIAAQYYLLDEQYKRFLTTYIPALKDVATQTLGYAWDDTCDAASVESLKKFALQHDLPLCLNPCEINGYSHLSLSKKFGPDDSRFRADFNLESELPRANESPILGVTEFWGEMEKEAKDGYGYFALAKNFGPLDSRFLADFDAAEILDQMEKCVKERSEDDLVTETSIDEHDLVTETSMKIGELYELDILVQPAKSPPILTHEEKLAANKALFVSLNKDRAPCPPEYLEDVEPNAEPASRQRLTG